MASPTVYRESARIVVGAWTMELSMWAGEPLRVRYIVQFSVLKLVSS